jgi:hypothetical protein
MDVNFTPTKLVRPTGPVTAIRLGAIGDTGKIAIRYWQVDPMTARHMPIVIAARYCPEHCILFLDSDFPLGCPECWKSQTFLDAPLSK